jgi:hypothetical protein
VKLFAINDNYYSGNIDNYHQFIKHLMDSTGSSISTSHEKVEFLSPYVNLYDVEAALKRFGLEQVDIINIIKKEV